MKFTTKETKHSESLDLHRLRSSGLVLDASEI